MNYEMPKKGKWANSMQFASRVLLFIHQQADGLQNRDLLSLLTSSPAEIYHICHCDHAEK